MRRRYVRYVPPEPAAERSTILLMAAGAVAGAAAGLLLGRKYGSLGAFVDDMKDRIEDFREAWDELDEEDDVEALPDGEDEDQDDDDDVVVSEVDDWDEEEDDVDEEDAEDDDEIDIDSELDEEEDDEEDEDDDEDWDDLEEDYEPAATSNGAAGRQDQSAEAAARRLEALVLDALSDDRKLRARGIEIAVVGDGVVELTGAVRSIEEISRAAALVRRVPGVAMVLNRIEVRTAGHVDTASVPRDPAGSGSPDVPDSPP
jgi:hypothetical protein